MPLHAQPENRVTNEASAAGAALSNLAVRQMGEVGNFNQAKEIKYQDKTCHMHI